jgi:hypothetical protein
MVDLSLRFALMIADTNKLNFEPRDDDSNR